MEKQRFFGWRFLGLLIFFLSICSFLQTVAYAGESAKSDNGGIESEISSIIVSIDADLNESFEELLSIVGRASHKPAAVLVRGGKLVCRDGLEIGSAQEQSGRLELKAGTVDILQGDVILNGGNCILEMSGGDLILHKPLDGLKINAFGSSGLDLWGGTIRIRNGNSEDGGTGLLIQSDPNTGRDSNLPAAIDIRNEGRIILDGDKTKEVNSYVDDGLITAYDGNGTVSAFYDESVSITSIEATCGVPDLACNDCIIDMFDYAVLANWWLRKDCAAFNDCEGADIITDGQVNWSDLAELTYYWLMAGNQ